MPKVRALVLALAHRSPRRMCCIDTEGLPPALVLLGIAHATSACPLFSGRLCRWRVVWCRGPLSGWVAPPSSSLYFFFSSGPVQRSTNQHAGRPLVTKREQMGVERGRIIEGSSAGNPLVIGPVTGPDWPSCYQWLNPDWVLKGYACF